MNEPWSFYEDAVHGSVNGDVAKGRAVIDPTVEQVKRWCIETHRSREQSSSGSLFLIVVASVTLLVSAWYQTSVITLILAPTPLIAAFCYWHARTYYSRLEKNVRNGANPPKAFTDNEPNGAQNYVATLFSTERITFDIFHNPCRLAHIPTALDKVWLTDIDEARALKKALCGSDVFPVTISRPMEKGIATKSRKQRKARYTLVQQAYVDQRQVHIYTSSAATAQQNETCEMPDKANDIPERSLEPHWLGQISEAKFFELFVEFEKHLPDSLKWMALIVWQAKPIVDRHQDWTDLKILKETLSQLQESAKWKLLRKPPTPATIEKLLYRDRNNSYTWVRRFFLNVGSAHKYNKTSQISLGI